LVREKKKIETRKGSFPGAKKKGLPNVKPAGEERFGKSLSI